VAMGLQHWWKTGAAPNDYEIGLAEDTFQGQRVAYLRSIVRPARSFGRSARPSPPRTTTANASGSRRRSRPTT
jgi:hypothetical protein